MKIEEFEDIENFFNAYKARYIDFKHLNDKMENNKILIMHIGGIVVECCLKNRIIKSNNLVKALFNNKYWYKDSDIRDLLSLTGNISNKSKKGYGIENPGHELIKIAKLDDFLNKTLSSDERFKVDLEVVHNPIRVEGKSFIDLRYAHESDIDNIEELYNTWKESFNRVMEIIKF